MFSDENMTITVSRKDLESLVNAYEKKESETER